MKTILITTVTGLCTLFSLAQVTPQDTMDKIAPVPIISLSPPSITPQAYRNPNENIIYLAFAEITEEQYTIEYFEPDLAESEGSILSDTKQQLKNDIVYPEFARTEQLEGFVCLCFTYNEDGEIEIIESNASDDRLKNYIINHLMQMKLENGLITKGQTYYTRFNFIRS